ncbi:MAG TPA: hypothetical protein VEI97_05695, partial [bacterium]|nr:hypothetical protein [bacterium]
PPADTGSEAQGPVVPDRSLTAPKASSELTVAEGFTLTIFRTGLNGPRGMARRGDEVWVSERGADRIIVLRDRNRDGAADQHKVAVNNIPDVHNIEYFNGWFYFADIENVYRFRDDDNNLRPDAPPEAFITGLPAGRVRHITRTVKVNPVDGRLYVSIGSSCDVCEEDDPRRATIQVFNIDGTGGEEFAGGLRNAVGYAFDEAGQLWTTNNGSDDLGPLLPPEGLWAADDGDFMGWPYAYNNNGVVVPHPTFGALRPDLVAATELPLMEFEAHSAPLGITFWRGDAWGEEFEGDAFIAFHGSHTFTTQPNYVGYEVVHVDFENGLPVSSAPVVTGFEPEPDEEEDEAIGRPVDVLQFGNALLFTDDLRGRIYRLSRTGS